MYGVTLIAQKGGTGETTLAINLAVAAEAIGLRTAGSFSRCSPRSRPSRPTWCGNVPPRMPRPPGRMGAARCNRAYWERRWEGGWRGVKSARRAARAPFRRAVPPQGRGQVPIVRGAAVVEAPVNVLYLPAEVT